jgi:putative spermidine/putrescine transport system substrate-binding protein
VQVVRKQLARRSVTRRSVARAIGVGAVLAVLASACAAASPPDGATAAANRDAAADAAEDPADWNQVLEAASGATLNLHMWGGSTEINQFVDQTYGPRLAELGITLNRVPLADTADAVNAVLGQLEAGRTDGGSIDLIWINGENFATMRQADALLSGWAERLPNAALVDWDDPSVAFDAGMPVDGDESPWGSAQFQFVYDSARMDEADLPRSYADLADWIRDNPGRFTYPAPPAFHGTRFIKQWFYEATGGADPWTGEVDDAEVTDTADDLWRLLDDLRPHLWRNGETYPQDIADLDRLFANGEVDLTFTQLPAGIDANIAAGVLPNTARPFVFDTGTIGDHHYLAIPINAANPAAAMAFANLVLEPDLQLAKLDPANGWGDGLAIAPDRLDEEQTTMLDELVAGFGPTAVDQARLASVRLPETRAVVTTILEDGWDRHVRQRQPFG